MRAMTLRAVSVIQRPRITPTKANGTENIITNGLMNDSNWDAITIYTMMIISNISIPRLVNISFWSSKSPAMLADISEGISILPRISFAAATPSLIA